MTNNRFAVELTRQAERDLKALRPWTAHVTRILLQLEDDPFKGHTLSGSLKGARSLEFSLRGVGQCRAVYTALDDEKVCIVFIVGSHENIYREAERRLEALKRQPR